MTVALVPVFRIVTTDPLTLIGSGLTRYASELDTRPDGQTVLIYRHGRTTSRRYLQQETRVKAAKVAPGVCK